MTLPMPTLALHKMTGAWKWELQRQKMNKNPTVEDAEGQDEGWNPGTAAADGALPSKDSASSMRSGQVRSVSDNLVSSRLDSALWEV